jgi:hypothetical protein
MPYLASMMGVTAFYFGYQYRHFFQELIRSSDEDQLKVLTFSTTEFQSIQWTEENREFTLDGKMYDVARVEQKNDVYTVYCEHDAFEDAVISWMKVNGEKSTTKSNSIISFFEIVPVFDCEPGLMELRKSGTQSYCFYSSFEPEVNTPPPRFL